MHSDTDSPIEIRPGVAADATSLARIYNHYIRETVVTFEEQPVPDAEMASRLQKVQGDSFPWLVAVRAGDVVGYAYASQWKPRSGYRFAAEVSVYLDPGHVDQGIGSALYRQALSTLQASGIHVAIGGVALPNDASVKLHEKLGFEKVAHFREVGFKFHRWIDVAYWEKFLR